MGFAALSTTGNAGRTGADALSLFNNNSKGASPWAANFGEVAGGLGSLASIYGAWQGAKTAKAAQKQAQQSSMFTQAFDVANLSQGLQSQSAINRFMGGTGDDQRYQLSSYLSPEIQNKYMAQGMFDGAPQGNQMLPNGTGQYSPAPYTGFNQAMQPNPQSAPMSNPISMGNQSAYQGGFTSPMNAPMQGNNNMLSTTPDRQDRVSGYGGF
jgi:hypothetical protein|tara:strand:- start:89 stop:721 length:633 start_codon:yes stop_codon:yes gene_type:complete